MSIFDDTQSALEHPDHISPTAIEPSLDTLEELGGVDSQTSSAFARSEDFIGPATINRYIAAHNSSISMVTDKPRRHFAKKEYTTDGLHAHSAPYKRTVGARFTTSHSGGDLPATTLDQEAMCTPSWPSFSVEVGHTGSSSPPLYAEDRYESAHLSLPQYAQVEAVIRPGTTEKTAAEEPGTHECMLFGAGLDSTPSSPSSFCAPPSQDPFEPHNVGQGARLAYHLVGYMLPSTPPTPPTSIKTIVLQNNVERQTWKQRIEESLYSPPPAHQLSRPSLPTLHPASPDKLPIASSPAKPQFDFPGDSSPSRSPVGLSQEQLSTTSSPTKQQLPFANRYFPSSSPTKLPPSSPPPPFSSSPVKQNISHKVEVNALPGDKSMVSLLSIPSSPVESSSTGSLVGQPQMRIKRRNSVTDKDRVLLAPDSRVSAEAYPDDFDQQPEPKRRKKVVEDAPPNPKRPTVASQRLQHKKLATPFRSPLARKTSQLVPHPTEKTSGTSTLHASSPTPPLAAGQFGETEPQSSPTKINPSSAGRLNLPTPRKNYSARAAVQFKSPLSAGTQGSSSSQSSSVRLTPKIQSLERQVQVLKRAIKIKKEREAASEGAPGLEELAKKWKAAGRDAAWEVWGLVKESAAQKSSEGASGWGWDEGKGSGRGGSGMGGSWGWDQEGTDERGEGERHDERERSSRRRGGEDYEERYEGEAMKTEETVGTMLRHLHIDPATLGWDDDQGDFVDADTDA